MYQLLHAFRWVAWLEGSSFLVLLFVAMPLKYLAEMPLPVRIVGLFHGVLFLAYVSLTAALFARRTWSFGRAAEALGMGLVPFGTFFFDRSVKRELAAAPPSA